MVLNFLSIFYFNLLNDLLLYYLHGGIFMRCGFLGVGIIGKIRRLKDLECMCLL